MKVSGNGIKFIRQEEGVRLRAYQNAGDVPTIGVGATFYEDGSKVKMTDVISIERADSLLGFHLRMFEKGVSDSVTSQINQNQFDALCSFVFNVGLGAFRKSTLLKKVNANPNDPAIAGEFAKWISKGKPFEKTLVKRRAHESALYFKPIS
jgi:lysozyme